MATKAKRKNLIVIKRVPAIDWSRKDGPGVMERDVDRFDQATMSPNDPTGYGRWMRAGLAAGESGLDEAISDFEREMAQLRSELCMKHWEPWENKRKSRYVRATNDGAIAASAPAAKEVL